MSLCASEINLCKSSFEYFCKSYLNVKEDIEFDSYLGRENYASFLKEYSNSKISALFISWLCIFHNNNSVGIISKNMNDAKEIMKNIYSSIKTFPKWFVPDFYKKTQTSFTLINGSKCYSTGSHNPECAMRGRAISFLIINSPMNKNIEIILTQNIPVLVNTKRNNIPYKQLIFIGKIFK